MAQGGTRTEDEEITEKALFATLALCGKNLFCAPMECGRHGDLMLT